jgi:hypothetical protein
MKNSMISWLMLSLCVASSSAVPVINRGTTERQASHPHRANFASKGMATGASHPDVLLFSDLFNERTTSKRKRIQFDGLVSVSQADQE